LPNLRNKQGGKKPHVDKTKLMTRIIVLILAALMVLGSCAMAVMYGLSSKTAVDVPVGASTALYPGETVVRVGLAYSNTAVPGYALSADGGFSLGSVDDKHTYTEYWQVSDSSLAVACDFHLRGSGTSYTLGLNGNADVGGYHIALMTSDSDILDQSMVVEQALKDGSAFGSGGSTSNLDYYAYPAMLAGKYAVLVGDYSTEWAVNTAIKPLLEKYPNASVISPDDSGSVVVGTDGRIRFLYRPASSNHYLAVRPASELSDITYGSYRYGGVFRFNRSATNLCLINLMPLEQYIEGVLPYEISASWPVEAQKAFSVAVRNFTLISMDSHKKYGFDVCSTTCCQVYRGSTRVNATVKSCVAATKGIVSTYNGEIMKNFYSSSVGGTTVNVHDCWGGTQHPYLSAIPTPWEKYEEHSNGSWTTEFTPKALLNRLRSMGYTSLSGAIASVKVNSFSKGSTYVSAITFTDTYGVSVKITNSDRIRTVLGTKSANFVVGKAGEKVSVTDYGLAGYGEFADESVEKYPSITIVTAEGTFTTSAASPLYALTGQGKKLLDAAPSVWIRHATDVERFMSVDENATELPKTEKSGLLDFNKLPVVSRERTITLKGTSGSFVFEGRGWGHGVGSSQYGYYDLARMGYTWEEIIGFYYKGCVLMSYRDLV